MKITQPFDHKTVDNISLLYKRENFVCIRKLKAIDFPSGQKEAEEYFKKHPDYKYLTCIPSYQLINLIKKGLIILEGDLY